MKEMPGQYSSHWTTGYGALSEDKGQDSELLALFLTGNPSKASAIQSDWATAGEESPGRDSYIPNFSRASSVRSVFLLLSQESC